MDSRWLASLLMLHGWLAAVCCAVKLWICSSNRSPGPGLGFARAFPAEIWAATTRSGTHLDLAPSLRIPHTLPPWQARAGAFHLFLRHAQ